MLADPTRRPACACRMPFHGPADVFVTSSSREDLGLGALGCAIPSSARPRPRPSAVAGMHPRMWPHRACKTCIINTMHHASSPACLPAPATSSSTLVTIIGAVLPGHSNMDCWYQRWGHNEHAAVLLLAIGTRAYPCAHPAQQSNRRVVQFKVYPPVFPNREFSWLAKVHRSGQGDLSEPALTPGAVDRALSPQNLEHECLVAYERHIQHRFIYCSHWWAGWMLPFVGPHSRTPEHFHATVSQAKPHARGRHGM